MDDATLTIDNIHSTPKTTTTDKKSLPKKTPNRPKPPMYTIRGWTMNRHDKKIYSTAGESRVMTSEEWRTFQLLNKQWRNKLEEQKQVQHERSTPVDVVKPLRTEKIQIYYDYF